MPRAREPRREIAHVYLDVVESTGLALYAITYRFCDKARRTSVRVPVVVCEVMEARFGDPSTEKVSANIPRPIEGNREVEYTSCRLARSRGDDTRVGLSVWNAHSALVRMSGKILDHAGRSGIAQKLVYGTDRGSSDNRHFFPNDSSARRSSRFVDHRANGATRPGRD